MICADLFFTTAERSSCPSSAARVSARYMLIGVTSRCGSTSRTDSSRCGRYAPTTTSPTYSQSRCLRRCTIGMCRLREALPVRALSCPISGVTAPLSLPVAFVKVACSNTHALGVSQRGVC
eukprot:2191074-Pleurochrysis_carterae.AAC.1